MNNFLSWWHNIVLPPTSVPVMMVCAVVGAFLLSLYTRWMGLVTFFMNGIALFAGAYVANALAANLRLPFDRFYVQPIVLSVAGMSVIAVLMLLVFAKSRNEN